MGRGGGGERISAKKGPENVDTPEALKKKKRKTFPSHRGRDSSLQGEGIRCPAQGGGEVEHQVISCGEKGT